MKKYLYSLGLVVIVFSLTIKAQMNLGEANFTQSTIGSSVLLGTYFWDAETDSFPNFRTLDPRKADIWWQQVDTVKQNIVPLNGALITQIFDRDFTMITAEDLKFLRYSKKAISNETLTPGSIIAIRTSEGNFVKLKIVGYRSLQDFSFKEAQILGECWKLKVLTEIDRPNYHLEVEWVLFTKQ